MKGKLISPVQQLSGWIIVSSLLVISGSAFGAFIGPYALTPPAAGTYTNQPSATVFGGWVATNVLPDQPDTFRSVNTGGAPTTLNLQVGDITAGGLGVDMTFTTVIVDTGTLSFDFIAGYGGGGTNSLEFLVNGVAVETNPVSGSYSATLVAGNTFGFRLSAIYDGAYASQVMVNVTNFVPEPTIGLLGCGGAFLCLRRRRQC